MSSTVRPLMTFMERQPIEHLEQEVSRLGPLRATYRPSLVSLLTRYAMAGLGFLVVAFCVVDVVRPKAHREEAGSIALVVIALIVAVVGLLSACFLRNTIWKAHQRILVFAAGLIQTQRENFVFVRWDDITVVWQAALNIFHHGLKVATTQKVTIETEQGERLVFDSDLKDMSDLSQIIEQEVTPRLLGGALETLAAGGTVPFGRVGVCPDGLKCGESMLRWDELQPIHLHKGFITLRQAGKWRKWFKMRTAEFPNLIVFLPLVKQMADGLDIGEGEG